MTTLRDHRAASFVAVAAHLMAVAIAVLALRLFLTPHGQIETIPGQPVRYVIYALAIFAMASAAGTVVALFATGSSWLLAIYLWLIPLGIVLYPAIDPPAANFVYVGVTSHVAGVFVIVASLLWILGIAIGALAVLSVTARIPWHWPS